MKPDNQIKLFKECPILFKFRLKDPPPYLPIHWGIKTNGDGWNQLIETLCYSLESLLKSLPEQERQDCGVLQIKEKFGGLRFYVTHYSDEMDQLITEAEKKSFHICEQCGKEGSLTIIRRTYCTLCPTCKEKIV